MIEINILEMVIAIFLILIIIMTFISEPKLSLQYFKATGKSVGVVFGKIKDTITDWRDRDKQDDTGPTH